MGVWIWTAIFLGVSALVVVGVARAALQARRRRKALAGAEAPLGEPIAFLDARLAVAPSVFGRTVPEGYRLASLFFGTGLIDRTRTLDQGFDYAVLDPIPEIASRRDPALPTLLERRAAEIRAQADRKNASARLFWSGGIDSTAAACALLKAFGDEPRRLEFVYTDASVREYRLFYNHYVAHHPARRKVRALRDAFGGDALLVTGEHGDQLFGSLVARRARWRALMRPWEDGFEPLLAKHLGGAARARATLSYLEPQIAACPIPLPRLFDLLWWLNFSLKWQAVSLRMIATGDARDWALRERFAHFFRPAGFQAWALAHPEARIGEDWRSYKEPLKAEILRFTGDQRYYDRKQKEPSLRGRLGARDAAYVGLALGVGASGAAQFQEFDRSLASEWSIGFTFSYEAALWRDLDDGE